MQPSLNRSVDEEDLPSEETSDNKADTSLGLIESETNKMVNGFDKFFTEGLPKVALPKQLDHEDILERDNELNLEEAKPEMVSARDKHYLPPLDQGMYSKNKSFMLRMNKKDDNLK